MFTDGDGEMRRAICVVFPDTIRLRCIFHISKTLCMTSAMHLRAAPAAHTSRSHSDLILISTCAIFTPRLVQFHLCGYNLPPVQ
mmetsp:Transcript_23246/g.63008  ORF Transcript_23246/g.63008 Transcript_23246/m.63008 type:complete len:84 (-) Transcript_23246:6-257(-)